jgi:hypothetical protein
MPRSLFVVPTLVVPLLVLATAGGCAGSARPTGSPSAAVPATSTGDAASALDDPPGTNTCHLLVDAVDGATLMNPGVVDAIAQASSTADAPVEDAAHRLAAAYAAAVTAKGSDGEPDAIAAVSATASDMSRVCDDSGLETVG